jgi:hypothetical protein
MRDKISSSSSWIELNSDVAGLEILSESGCRSVMELENIFAWGMILALKGGDSSM